MTDIDLDTLILGEAMAKKDEKPELTLEPSPKKAGEVPKRVIEELMNAKETAHDCAQIFSDACKTQAEKYGVNCAALKEYITARVGDKIEAAKAKATGVMDLIG